MNNPALATLLVSVNAGYWGGEPGTADKDVAVIRNGDIKLEGVRWNSLPTRAFKSSEVSKSRVREGDILLTTSGECGQVAMVATDPERETCATNFVRVLRFDPALVDARYAFHFLSGRRFRNALAPYIRGTTLKNLSTREAFLRVSMPLPPLHEQERSAAILDQVDLVRIRRRRIVDHLESLERALFLDLFATEAASSKVEEVAVLIRTGPFGSQLLHGEFVDRGISVLGLDNVVGNEFRWVGRRYITPDKYFKLKRYTVRPGDVLISIMGTVGRCVVTPNDIPTAINTKHICAITPDQQRIDPLFLRAAFLWHPQSRGHLRRQTKGSIMDGLNMGIIKAMPIPVPSLQRQREFGARVEQINIQRAAVRRALVADEELLASLQYRAFRGEL